MLGIDGTDVGDFAESWLIKPLDEVVGARAVAAWDGWPQIPAAVRQLAEFRGRAYGVPDTTDGRVLFYNKALFARAGLPADWQPRGWDDVVAAAAALRALPGVTPVQLDGGGAMAEAATINGFLPLLAGAGALIYRAGKWQGDTGAMRAALGFYQRIYRAGLADPVLDEEAQGRDASFAAFAAGRIGIYPESDYFWRSVLASPGGSAPMPDRDTAVGYALIPAQRPGAGVDGSSYVSFSGGGVRLVNPNTAYPQQAWRLLTFLASAPAMEVYERRYLGSSTQIMPRTDVNDALLARDPLMRYIARNALPCTHFRPSEGDYARVSELIQQATADVIGGRTAAAAAADYARGLAGVVGEANVVDD